MPKRKHKEDADRLQRKISKLQLKLQILQAPESSESTTSDMEEVLPFPCYGADTPALCASDYLMEEPEPPEREEDVPEPGDEPPEPEEDAPEPESAAPKPPEPEGEGEAPEAPEPEVEVQVVSTDVSAPSADPPNTLDNDILEILGEDPSSVEKYGPEIRSELSSRLTHIATEGLSKETRKELITKYPIPSNAIKFDAPKLNMEIKAAIPEAAVKRDKGIEIKQKQMASAISCLSQVINSQLLSAGKDKGVLQKVMDANRIICDIQHADSVTRRNFVLFSLKNDLKEHIKNTKIDTYLFSENLPDTIKTAKAVTRSGTELKADAVKQNALKKFKNTKPLNRRAPPQYRRPTGQASTSSMTSAPRSREPAAQRAYLPPQAPPAQSSRRSSQPPRPHHRN